MTLPALSYSAIKTYQTCPKKYYHVKVAKDIKEDQNTEAILYGKSFHKAAEDYVKSNVPIPDEFQYAKPALDTIRSMPGDKYCEYEMGLTVGLEPCGFKDPNVWFRGIADLVVVNGTKARVLDYKTGRSAKYADTGQLELMALCIFKHFPQVRSVKGGLLFVVANDFKPANFVIEDTHTYWRNWMPTIQRMEVSYNTGVWNPNKNGLCKAWCPVLECTHNGKSERN